MWTTLGAMVKTALVGSGGTLPFDLAGDWLPCRHDEWRNRNRGSHKERARNGKTKLTFRADGTGSGTVGEFSGLRFKVTCVAAGQYTGSLKWGQGFVWSATDGNYTLLADGTLQVEYPSNGIVEYWTRRDGRGAQIFEQAHAEAAASEARAPSRPVALVIRHFGPANPLGDERDMGWHWGIAVGEEQAIYEVGGMMAVIGPKGVVAATSTLVEDKRTELSQYEGYLKLPQTTKKSDKEIKEFSRQWVKQHPVYRFTGPNCQTYAEDLFTFCCGENLPFAKSASRLSAWGRGNGPEQDPNMRWLRGRR